MPKIESLAHGELIQLAKDLRERLIIYEGLIFRSKEREFGKSSERGSSGPQNQEPESETNNLSQGEENPPGFISKDFKAKLANIQRKIAKLL